MAADAQQIGLSIIVEGTVMANEELITGVLGNPEVIQLMLSKIITKNRKREQNRNNECSVHYDHEDKFTCTFLTAFLWQYNIIIKSHYSVLLLGTLSLSLYNVNSKIILITYNY